MPMQANIEDVLISVLAADSRRLSHTELKEKVWLSLLSKLRERRQDLNQYLGAYFAVGEKFAEKDRQRLRNIYVVGICDKIEKYSIESSKTS